MDYVEFLSESMSYGVDELWRSIKAMPEDKLDWRPEPMARTARELLHEIVSTQPFNTKFIRTQKMPEWDESKPGKETLEEIEKKHREYVADFLKAVKEFPVKDLHKKNELPWGTMTFFDLMSYPYWNLMYHLGQINYIQTMYGDKDMH